jgi:hypothetical protein
MTPQDLLRIAKNINPQRGTRLCSSCEADFESGIQAIQNDESILDRLIREHRVRAKMPRFGLKPEIR